MMCKSPYGMHIFTEFLLYWRRNCTYRLLWWTGRKHNVAPEKGKGGIGEKKDASNHQQLKSPSIPFIRISLYLIGFKFLFSITNKLISNDAYDDMYKGWENAVYSSSITQNMIHYLQVKVWAYWFEQNDCL